MSIYSQSLDTQSEISSLGGSVSTYKTNLSDDDEEEYCKFISLDNPMRTI